MPHDWPGLDARSKGLTMAPSQRAMGRQDRSSLADPPLRRVAFAQFFGLAASIAARLTIWLISLACSASDRICACT
jgi:hypothetical protein